MLFYLFPGPTWHTCQLARTRFLIISIAFRHWNWWVSHFIWSSDSAEQYFNHLIPPFELVNSVIWFRGTNPIRFQFQCNLTCVYYNALNFEEIFALIVCKVWSITNNLFVRCDVIIELFPVSVFQSISLIFRFNCYFSIVLSEINGSYWIKCMTSLAPFSRKTLASLVSHLLSRKFAFT